MGRFVFFAGLHLVRSSFLFTLVFSAVWLCFLTPAVAVGSQSERQCFGRFKTEDARYVLATTLCAEPGRSPIASVLLSGSPRAELGLSLAYLIVVLLGSLALAAAIVALGG